MRAIRRAGFTLSELLVALTISGIVGTAVVKLLITQFRGYGNQVSMGDASETLRGAAALLSWEIRHAAMASDTLLSLSPDTLSVRSVQGAGIVCAKKSSAAMYGIWKNGGDIEDTPDDSALISVGGSATGVRAWKKVQIVQVGTAGAMGLAACAWPSARPPDLVVLLAVNKSDDTSGIAVGALFRSFRRTVFAEYQDAGRWWLGRRVGSGAWDKVTGPLLQPASGGLKFAYYGAAGTPVASGGAVRVVGVALKSQSYRRVSAGAASAYRVDSLTTRVLVRQ